MELSCSSTTSIMASRIPPTLSSRRSSLAFANSSFFSYGGKGLSTRSLSLVSARRSSRGVGRGAAGARCLFGLGVPELVVIAGVAALVFGPKQLPEIGRSIGKTVKSFQQAAKEFETELKKEPEDANNPENPKPLNTQKEQEELEASSTKDNI